MPEGNTLSYNYDDRGNLKATDAQGGPNPDGSSSLVEKQSRLRYNEEGMDSSKRTGPNGTLGSSTEGKGTDATEDSDTWKRYTTTYIGRPEALGCRVLDSHQGRESPLGQATLALQGPAASSSSSLPAEAGRVVPRPAVREKAAHSPITAVADGSPPRD